jgi:hypothetical protein
MVGLAEGVLNQEEVILCEAHLESCASCQGEYAAIKGLQQRLVTRGRSAAAAAMVAPVMQRIRAVQAKPERETIMSILARRWRLGVGVGAVAGLAAIVVGILVVSSLRAEATASEILSKGAKAMSKLTSVHLRGNLRTPPAENFSYLDPKCDFQTIELWKQWRPDLKWRIDKPGRAAAMDGQGTLLYIKPANTAMKVPQASTSAFDTEWLHAIANLSGTLESEIQNAKARSWQLGLTEERGKDGRNKAVVTVHAKAGVPANDYLKNKFFDTSDTRRVYRFDSESELLERVQVFLAGQPGEALVFDLELIEFNQPISATIFQLALPADVKWYRDEMQRLPDNEKYAALTAEQAARAYFEALASANWVEAEKFRKDEVAEKTKQLVKGLEVVSVGTAFTSQGYDPDGRFVPYEIKLRGQAIKHNLALKKDKETGRWFVDGGGF